jgi:hypothetical protein
VVSGAAPSSSTAAASPARDVSSAALTVRRRAGCGALQHTYGVSTSRVASCRVPAMVLPRPRAAVGACASRHVMRF